MASVIGFVQLTNFALVSAGIFATSIMYNVRISYFVDRASRYMLVIETT
jgi:hypothetical protein